MRQEVSSLPTTVPSASPRVATARVLLGAAALPRSEALLLLAHAADRRRESLLADPDDALDDDVAAAFARLCDARADGVPVAYLVGSRDFHGVRLGVDPRVLIPRPETELLVDAALVRIGRHGARRIVDLGTGSGAIAVAIAAAVGIEGPDVDVVATDRSADALAVAAANAVACNVRIRFARGDWFDALDPGERFDVVVANPPYVAAGDAHLARGDLRFEPREALTDGADGLSALRAIVAGAPARLAAGGALIVEHGHEQAATVRAMCHRAGFVAVESTRDLAGIERITTGALAFAHPATLASARPGTPPSAPL